MILTSFKISTPSYSGSAKVGTIVAGFYRRQPDISSLGEPGVGDVCRADGGKGPGERGDYGNQDVSC